jgi:hypothetical protein
MMKFFMMCLGVVALASVANAGAVATAKADGVQVFADAANGAAVIATLKANQSLPCGERKGMFWEVTAAGGKKGFVSILKVNRKVEESAGLVNAMSSVVTGGRAGGEDVNAGRSRSAVMGVRGLGPSETASTASNVKPNLRMVYDMEDRKVTEAQTTALGNDIASEIEKRASAQN